MLIVQNSGTVLHLAFVLLDIITDVSMCRQYFNIDILTTAFCGLSLNISICRRIIITEQVQKCESSISSLLLFNITEN